MLKELSIVRLKKENKKLGIKTSYDGVITDVPKRPRPDGKYYYTVEFFDEDNETIEASIMEEFPEDELIYVNNGYDDWVLGARSDYIGRVSNIVKDKIKRKTMSREEALRISFGYLGKYKNKFITR